MSKDNNSKKDTSPQPMGHGPGGRSSKKVEKPKDMKFALNKLFKALRPHLIILIVAVLLSVFATILSIIGPKVSSQITTIVGEGLFAKIDGSGGIDFDTILSIIKTMLIIYSASFVFNFIQRVMMNKVSQDVAYKLRVDISSKINRLPLSYFDKKTHGETLSVVTKSAPHPRPAP